MTGDISKTFKLTLEAWSAWAPTLVSIESWRSWIGHPQPLPSQKAPKCGFIPSALRRRSSELTRAALSVAHACTATIPSARTVRSVFASQRGESEITLSLLKSLAHEEELSPMGFSLSVHNASSGIFSICNQSHAATTAIAAREQTLSAGLFEVLGVLNRTKSEPVLLVLADELLPEAFRGSPSEGAHPYAVALLLSLSNEKVPGDIEMTIRSLPNQPLGSTLDFVSFISFLVSQEKSCHVVDSTHAWHFTRLNGTFDNLFYPVSENA